MRRRMGTNDRDESPSKGGLTSIIRKLRYKSPFFENSTPSHLDFLKIHLSNVKILGPN